jgi:hypothetical protein
MTTLVFPHGRGRDGTLMWSLRSIAAHYDPAELDIIIAGHLPDWLHPHTVTGIHVRQQHNRAMVNVWNALVAAVELIGDAPFVLMNDDFFATRAADLTTATHRGPAAAHVEAMRPAPSRAAYRSRLARSVRILAEEGRQDPASWETHTPLPTTGAAVRAVAALLRSRNIGGGVVAQRTLIAELAGTQGHAVADPKIYTGAAVPIPAPWVSTSPVSWHGATGEAIRLTYLTPSPWEADDARGAAARSGQRKRPHRTTPGARRSA